MSHLPYRIERTNNRSSRAVFADDMILIRLAGRLTQTEEQRHIDTLLKRMTKAQARYAARHLIDPFRPVLDGAQESILTFGDGSSRTVITKPAAITNGKIVNGMIVINKAPATSENIFHRFLWRMLSFAESDRIQALIHSINRETLCVQITGFRLRIMRSRLGSCSRRGMITINAALLFLPLKLLRYVVIHELAHIPHPNHSRAFWRTVKGVLPEYETHIRELKKYRLPEFDLDH